LINSVEGAVDEALEGLTLLHPGLNKIRGHRVILREKVDKSKVAILSGGGSGHEPFCAGYIGAGMLSAGVAGSVFASPPTSSILEAIRAIATDNPAGALVLVINYTGDRINFGLAVEKARNLGLKVEMFVNGEDCALTTSDKTAGRRGLCGTMFIFKIAGAMAEQGRSLQDIVKTTRAVSANMGTIGLALGPCSLPGQGPLFHVAEDVLELGLGVHGEAGVGQIPLTTAHNAVSKMLQHMTNPDSLTRLELGSGEQVAVILNNLGGTSKLEELIVAREVVTQLEAMGVTVLRMYAGHMMTSLEMSGILVSVLRVGEHPDWLDLLDAPTAAPAWPAQLMSAANANRFNPPQVNPLPPLGTQDRSMKGVGYGAEGVAKVKSILRDATNALIKLEDKLNGLDSGCGDGDCGSTHAAGAKGVLECLDELDMEHPWALLQQLGVAAEKMGGSSGGVYSLLFTAAASAFQDQVGGEVDPAAWIRALRLGLDSVMKYGGAEPGDRTMIDALYPALLRLEAAPEQLGADTGKCLKEAAAAARAGAEKTAEMVARAGRASYVSRDKVTAADPGAVAAAAWFTALADNF